MDLEVALKLGFLHIPPANFLRKSWIKKYIALFHASNHGIQRFEIFDREDHYLRTCPAKIIPLTDCVKVTPIAQKYQTNVFEVRTKTEKYEFSAESYPEMAAWISAVQSVAFNANQYKSSKTSPVTFEEKNVLYCSLDQPEVFSVQVVPTEASLRNNLQGEYELIVTTVHFSLSKVRLHGKRVGKVVLTWLYRDIRRYGSYTDSFSFEAGRKCTSGEGIFIFSTSEGSNIFQSISSHVSLLLSSQGQVAFPISQSGINDETNVTSKDSLQSNESKGLSNPSSDTYSEIEPKFKGSFKSIPPLNKPPRKTKSILYDKGSDNMPGANKMSTHSSNQYAEIRRAHSSENLLESPKMSDIVAGSSGEFSNASTEELSSCVERVKLTESGIKDNLENPTGINPDYENYNFAAARAAHSADHTYGQIVSKNTTMQNVSIDSGSVYSKIWPGLNEPAVNPDDRSPTFSNIKSKVKEVSKGGKSEKKPKKKGELENEPEKRVQIENRHQKGAKSEPGRGNNSEHEPAHFIQNDAEYAQVLKKNRKTP